MLGAVAGFFAGLLDARAAQRFLVATLKKIFAGVILLLAKRVHGLF